MNVWGIIKNAFFVVGSLAGILAWLRPAIESKHQEDMKRATAILGKFNEDSVVNLAFFTGVARKVPEEFMRPFALVTQALADNLQEVRFIGPLKKYLSAELHNMVSAYAAYREYVQVPEWEMLKESDSDEYTWKFNKAHFFPKGSGPSDDYAHHLEDAEDAADLVKLRFQRFQALTELHLFEALAAKIFVPRKFRTANLQLPKGTAGRNRGTAPGFEPGSSTL